MYKFELRDPHFLPHYGCDIEIVLEKGQIVLLAGENGIGKSTLIQRFFQETKYSACLVEQKELDYFYDRKLEKLKNIFLEMCLPVSTVRFQEYWKSFRLNEKEDRSQSHLSGGENQALKLCLGLSLEKDVFILDEPGQYLDQSSKTALEKILKHLTMAGKVVLLVEHDYSWLNLPVKVSGLEVRNGLLQKSRA